MNTANLQLDEFPVGLETGEPFIPMELMEVIVPLFGKLIEAAECEDSDDLVRLNPDPSVPLPEDSPARLAVGIRDNILQAFTGSLAIRMLMALHGPDGPGPLRYRLQRIAAVRRTPSDGPGLLFRLALIVEEDPGATFGAAMTQYISFQETLKRAMRPKVRPARSGSGWGGKRTRAASHGEPSTAIS